MSKPPIECVILIYCYGMQPFSPGGFAVFFWSGPLNKRRCARKLVLTYL